MLDDRTDALFPQPQSPAGKLLSYLVARQIPGTPIDTTIAGVARSAGLRPPEASAALAKLADDGLVLVEPATTGDAATITVLLAPPLDEYGIRPEWTEAGAPVSAIPAAPPAPADAAASATSASAAPGPHAAPTAAGQLRTRHRGPAVASREQPAESADPAQGGGPATPTAPRRDGSTARAPLGTPADARIDTPAGASAAAGDGAVAGDETTPPAGAASLPAAAVSLSRGGRTSGVSPRPRVSASETTTQQLPLSDDGEPPARATARRGGEPAAVDETALVRGFVDRFERLLAELDEWKRRAQSAEERTATTEKLLRSAERRAETAEARLVEAQERLRTWAELTRRMQQLSRQADGGRARTTAGRFRSPPGGGGTTAGETPAGRDGSGSPATG